MLMSFLRPFARIGLAVALVFAASSARAQDVGYNAMPGVDFAKFKTYKWIKIKDAQYPDQIADTQIMQALDSELATKGLTKTDDDTADLYVGYQVALSQEKQLNTFDSGGAWGPGPGYRGYGYGGGGMSTSTTTTIHVGTLSLDLYDRAAKQLVWRGMASKTLDPQAKPDKRVKNLNKGAKKMLKNYPPPVKK